MDSTSLVIVAIPSQKDPVWKVSSEKVPHLTILYLGKQDLGPEAVRVAEFVEHAASFSLKRFGMSVDRRGELGPDKADVLFFENSFSREIKEFRANLLKDETINKLYNSVEQYPSWTPHITLGFPETPAKPDRDDYGINWVNFDRIALWTGDYEGFEIPLKNEYEFDGDVAMSDPVSDFLAHFGVKGMKWGVRNNERGAIRRGATKANVALGAGGNVIKEGEKKLIFLPKEYRRKAASATQTRVLGAALEVNQSPKFNGKDIKKNPALRNAYYKQVEKKAVSIYKEELSSARTEATMDFIDSFMSPSQDSVSFTAPSDRIRHEDQSDEVLLTLNFTKNELGQIVGVDIPDEFLAHFGVKGMKWGVRKDESSSELKTYTSAKAAEAAVGNKKISMKQHREQLKKLRDRDAKNLDEAKKQPTFRREVDAAKKGAGVISSLKNSSSVKSEFLPGGYMTSRFIADFKDSEGKSVTVEFANAVLTQATKESPRRPLINHSDEDAVDEFLAHFGVKGMKWGVRRTKAQIESASEDATKTQALKGRAKTSGTNALSNAELRAAIDRMNLETQYARLADQTAVKSRGRKAAEALLGDLVKDVVKPEVTRVGKATVSLRVEKELRDRGRTDIADRIKPKKK